MRRFSLCPVPFPRCSNHQADAKEAAIRDLPSPVGYRRCLVPPPSGNRSSVYDHGVRFEQDCDQREPKKQKWFCASSQRCRKLSMQGKGGIHCQDNGTGNVTRHLRDAHSERSSIHARVDAVKPFPFHWTIVSGGKGVDLDKYLNLG